MPKPSPEGVQFSMTESMPINENAGKAVQNEEEKEVVEAWGTDEDEDDKSEEDDSFDYFSMV